MRPTENRVLGMSKLTFMNVHMGMHLIPSGESAPTFPALVWFLASM